MGADMRAGMRFSRYCGVAALCALFAAAQPVVDLAGRAEAAPVPGTAFVIPDLLTSADYTVFTGLTDAGQADRLMFDRRTDSFVTYNAFLFNASFSDGFTVEFQVNPEFGTIDAARSVADFYATVIGRLPTLLRKDVQTVWLHKGDEDFGGGNNNLLIHTDRGTLYDAAGFPEEVFVHEAAHTSLDADHAADPDWLLAQLNDPDFISDYAEQFPTQEDIAESFLPWLATRYLGDRVTPEIAAIIEATIPNRLAYFDAQNFDVGLPMSAPGSLAVLGAGLAGLSLVRKRKSL
jgi:hypothetical protein